MLYSFLFGFGLFSGANQPGFNGGKQPKIIPLCTLNNPFCSPINHCINPAINSLNGKYKSSRCQGFFSNSSDVSFRFEAIKANPICLSTMPWFQAGRLGGDGMLLAAALEGLPAGMVQWFIWPMGLSKVPAVPGVGGGSLSIHGLL